MSVGALSRSEVVSGLLSGWQEWWTSTTASNRSRFQIGFFGVTCIVAFHYSLSSLGSNLSLSTPLAYISLVPVFAIALASGRAYAGSTGPDINDRQLDWIVGLPLLAAAAVILFLLPAKFSAMFWIWRLDLLAFPLFVAGTTALVFGTRALWRQKFSVGYLLLAWPLPYMLVLLKALNAFTSWTLAALRQLVSIVPVAKPVPGADQSVFQVVHHGHAFPLSVVSACSGVDSVVGFLLVGVGFAGFVRGPRLVKALWLLGGMLLLYAINLGRILFIFWAGEQWGEHVAINVLHPFVGLLTFSLGVLIMMAVMPILRLRFATRDREAPMVQRTKPAITNMLPAVGLLTVVAIVFGVNDSGLRSYDLVANAAGEPKLSSYSVDPAIPAGWRASYEATYGWAKPYFGETSTWLRYLYVPSGPEGDLAASVPITADVIDTTNLTSFSAYGVEACYDFHGYTMRDIATVKLAGGISGQALSYTASRQTWTIVYWIMPVERTAGGTLHYERVVLYVQDTPGTALSKLKYSSQGITSLHGALNARTPKDSRLIAARAFLAQFAREVILNQPRVGSSPVQASSRAPSQSQTSGASG